MSAFSPPAPSMSVASQPKKIGSLEELSDSLSQLQLQTIQDPDSIDKFLITAELTDHAIFMPVLIDSGAGDNFISQEFLQNNHLTQFVQYCTPHSARAAFKEIKIISQTIELAISIGSWKASISFFVIDELSESAIFGFRFIRKYCKIIDWDKLTFDHVPNTVPSPSNDRSLLPINRISVISSDQYERELRVKNQQFGIIQLQLTSIDSLKFAPDKESAQIFQQYGDVITNEKPLSIPDIGTVSHQIHLVPDSKPPARPPYRMSATENKILQDELQQLLTQGAIVPSSSPFSAPVLFVKKKDGSLRLCVDYRLLNQQTIKNRFPLPVIDDLIDSLGGAKFFSKLDLMAGYHQIRIDPQDEFKTAFSTRWGHYQFRVMPFGLTNAPATFKSFMNEILSPYLNKFVVVYLDDILIFSQSLTDHRKHLRMVLDVLRTHRLIAKKSKCELFTKDTTFLGFQLSDRGIRPLEDKIASIREFPVPNTTKKAMSFLGLASFYRRFIPQFSKIAGPLYDFVHDKAKWSSAQEISFETLKSALISPPVLIVPDLSNQFVLTTDASHSCVGAVLEQRDSNGKLQGVVSYYSKRLMGAELNYTVQEQECLGIIRALQHFRHLLIGRHFTLRTDHYSLTYLMVQSKTPQGRIARWLDTLAEYDFTIEHIPGNKNSVADALSRISVAAVSTPTSLSISFLEELKKHLSDDKYFGEIFETLQQSDSPVSIPKHLRHHIRHYRLIDGLLYFTTTVGADNLRWRLCVPDYAPLRKILMQQAHEPPTAGHFGPYKSYFLIAQQYYWPRMFKDVRRFIDACDTCLRCRGNSPGTDGLLQPLDIPEQRWSSISIDFVSGLPRSNGFNEIMVVVDRLTKRAHFVPTTDTIDAPGAARLFVRDVVRLHGIPGSIVSDRDVRFVSEFWTAMHDNMGSKLLFSTPHHPQTDGQTERVNRILSQLLRSYCFNELSEWSNYLDIVEFAYNNSYQKSIDTTPFIADLGYQPSTPGFHNSLTTSSSVPVEELSIKLKAILVRTQDQIAAAQRQQEAQANESRKPVFYKVGDYALINREIYVTSKTYRKVQPNFVGPFRIVAVGLNNCELDIPDHRKSHRVINVEHLRPYVLKSSYPKVPPKSELEAKSRVRDIIGIAGYDRTQGTWDLIWKDCHPGHIFTVSNDFVQQFVPEDLVDYIWQNTRFLTENRDDSSH